MSVNLTAKYSPLIAERFKGQSVTDAYAGKKYDFDGAQSIKIYTVDKVTLGDYNRSSAGGRWWWPGCQSRASAMFLRADCASSMIWRPGWAGPSR